MGYKPVRVHIVGLAKSPDPEVRRRLGVIFSRNCPETVRSGDGLPLGSCMYYLGDDGNTCPVHGDVSGSLWSSIITIRRSDMKKYGVEYDDQALNKYSTAKYTHCPNCGSELSKENGRSILHCPNCGTEPFEKKE